MIEWAYWLSRLPEWFLPALLGAALLVALGCGALGTYNLHRQQERLTRGERCLEWASVGDGSACLRFSGGPPAYTTPEPAKASPTAGR